MNSQLGLIHYFLSQKAFLHKNMMPTCIFDQILNTNE